MVTGAIGYTHMCISSNLSPAIRVVMANSDHNENGRAFCLYNTMSPETALVTR